MIKNFEIIVLSLKRSHERGQSIKNNLNELGLDFEFFDAFQKEDVPKKFLDEKLTKKLLGRPMVDGEIGCSYSHYKMLKKIAASKKVDFFLVLEDDVLLSESIHLIIKWLKNNPFYNDVIIKLPAQHFIPKRRTKIIVGQEFALFKNTALNYGSYATFIGVNMAKKLLKNYHNKIVIPADWIYEKYKDKIQTFGVWPHMTKFSEHALKSEIGQRDPKISKFRKKLISLKVVLNNIYLQIVSIT